MPKVDFYILKQPDEQDRQFFACRLAEKALNQGMKIYIHTDSEQSAQDMDDLLWSFRPDSFIPHAIVGVDEELMEDEEIHVFIGFGSTCDIKSDLLINLDEDIPLFHEEFERIAEIVPNSEDAKNKSRTHWNTYKNKGFELEHHPL